MSKRKPLPDGLPPAFATTSEGGPGLARHRLRHAALIAPTRGLRQLVGHGGDLRDRCRALSLVLPDDCAVGHATAAQLLGVPLPLASAWPTEPIHVVVPHGIQRPRRPGISGHRQKMPPSQVIEQDGIRLTSGARTWVDLGSVLAPEHLVAAGDAFLRHGLATKAELAQMVRWAAGRRGVAAVRNVQDLLDPRAESGPESRVRYWIVAAGLPAPDCNFDIVSDNGWVARVDLAWPRRRVALEYDGRFHGDDNRRRYDAARRNLIVDAGWRVLVLTSRDLRRPSEAVDLVRRALSS